jgi:hypothetical protein
MGGKTSTSTSQVSIPPEVLARYNSVNQTAQDVAQTPFQQYSTDPSAFVAPLTGTQQAGVANTNAASGMAQPYFGAATGFALAGSQAVNPSAIDAGAINQYYNPYVSSVLGSTEALINQQNQQQQAGQLGNAITSGAYGGDRSGIAAAVLAGQQQLAAGQTYSGILSDAYQQALATAQQQQGVGLGAEQANRAAVQQTGEALAGLGTGAQSAALAGAQAQLGAGQVEQQTQQAGKTAVYNQFLQQQSYPFQTAQFLANIAEGTGALSGSTTTAQQPQSIFSDERLKEDMIPVGKGFDGANIYRFRYRGDPTTRIGFSAQEMARLHPEAVHTHPSGFLTVDYGRATAAAAGFALAANDNYGDEPERRARAVGGRAGFADGGGSGMSGWGMYPAGTNPMVIQQLLESQAQMYGPFSGQGGPGLYGSSASAAPHGGSSYVPAANLPVGQLQVAKAPTPSQSNLGSDIHEAASFADDAEGLSKDYHFGHEVFDKLMGHHGGDDGGGDVPFANGGRVARAPGGLTAALEQRRRDVAEQEARNRVATLSHERPPVHLGPALTADADPRFFNTPAAQHPAVVAAKRAAAAPPDLGVGARGSVLGAVPGVQTIRSTAPYVARGLRMGVAAAPVVYHGAHQLVDADVAAHQAMQRATTNAAQTAGAYDLAAMGSAANMLQRQPWLTPHPPGWKPPPPKYVTDANAYLAPARGAEAGAAMGAQIPTPGGAPAAAGPAARPGPQTASGDEGYWGSGIEHAMRAAHHIALAHHHAQAAQAAGVSPSQVPTASAPGAASPNLADATGLPGNVASVTPMDVGDVSNLQSGFAPANMRAYNPNIFQRFGNWLGDEASGVGRWLTEPSQRRAVGEDVAAANQLETPTRQLAPPISSEAFQSGPVMQSEAFQSSRPPVAAASPALDAPVIQSEAFQSRDPRLVDASDLAPPVTLAAARGGFARAARQMGGPSDPSNPQNDDPYKPQGPGLNIPTAETQHPKLVTAPTPGQGGGGGLGSAIGMGSDLVNIAKFALPFFGVPVKTGGRVGYADGGDPPPPDPTDDPTVRPVTHDAGFAPADTSAPAPASPDSAPPASAPSGGGRRGGFGGALRDIVGAPLHLLGEAAGAPDQAHPHWDRDRLMPFLSMIGAIGATPTVHPLFALSQGLGAYGKTYMAQQQQEAEIAERQATAAQTRYETLPPAMRQGMTEIPGALFNPDGSIDSQRTHMTSSGHYAHWGYGTDLMPGAGGGGGAAAPGLANAQTIQGGHAGANAPVAPDTPTAAGYARGPVHADYKSGTYSFAPSSVSDASVAKLGPANAPLDVSGAQGAAMKNSMMIGMNPQLAGEEATNAKQAETAYGDPLALTAAQQQTRLLAQAVNAIPAGGLGAMGQGYEQRQNLLNLYQTFHRMVAGSDDPDINQATAPAAIISKIQSLQSQTMAHANDQHSYDAARAIASVLPGGSTANKAAANEILANLMTQTQRGIDFPQFEQAYVAKYGTHIGVVQAFQNETGGMYDADAKSLARMMTRGAGGQSAAEILMAHPDRRRDIEQGLTRGTQTRAGYGTGSARYWF